MPPHPAYKGAYKAAVVATLFALASIAPDSVEAFTSVTATVAATVAAPQSVSGPLFLSDSEGDDEPVVLFSDVSQDPPKRNARWKSLSPKVKEQIVKEAQERAVRNKKKNESADDKRRRE